MVSLLLYALPLYKYGLYAPSRTVRQIIFFEVSTLISNFGLGEILSLIRFSISIHTVSGCSIPHTDPSSFIPNQISPSPKLLYALTVFKNVFVIVDLNSRFFFSFTIITLFVFLYHITNEAQMKRKILRFIFASSFVYLQSISRAHTPRNSSSSSCAEA